MNLFYDKSLNPLLSENAGQSNSESDPSQWRSDSSTPTPGSSENESRKRHRKRFSVGQRLRRVLFVGALTIGLCLLILWLFLLLTDDGPKKMQNNDTTPTSSSFPPLLFNKVTIPQQTEEQKRRTDQKEKARKAQKHPQRHQQLIHVTAAPPATTAEKGTTQTATRTTTTRPPTAFVETMEMPKGWEEGKVGRERTQIVVAQMKRVGGTGKIAEKTTETPTTTQPKMTTNPPETTTNPPETTWTTKAPTTPLTKSTAETTKTSTKTTTSERISSQRQWTKSEEERGEEEEEDDNLLFWRGGYSGKHSKPRPRTDTFQPKTFSNKHLTTKSQTIANESVSAQQQQDGYNVARPLIQFGPMNAVEVAGRARDRQREEEEQQEEELNEIIASLEKENNFSPVEIPFPVESLPAVPMPEPVWRRPPPDETTAPTPFPKKPPSAAVDVSDVHKKNGLTMGAKSKLERKRREAPVIVTALLDIGRGEWPRFTRHFDQYLGYLANIVLRLQNHIIIYCDSLVTSYLQSLGEGIDWERIQVVKVSLQELPYYKYRNEIEDIMRWEQTHWHGDWDEQMRAHPETIYPDYDILVNSKPYFLFNATTMSRFSKPLKRAQQFFVWLDAGYGHGSVAEIPYGVWSPALKTDKITLVQLTPKIDRVERYTLDKVYRKQKSVVSGGFLAGSPEAIKRFHTFFHKSFLEMLDEKMVDDDQTTLLVTIQKYQSDFHIIFGGWFDAFKLLPSQ